MIGASETSFLSFSFFSYSLNKNSISSVVDWKKETSLINATFVEIERYLQRTIFHE